MLTLRFEFGVSEFQNEAEESEMSSECPFSTLILTLTVTVKLTLT